MTSENSSTTAVVDAPAPESTPQVPDIDFNQPTELTEASTSTAVLYAAYEFERAVRAAVRRELAAGWEPWVGQPTDESPFGEETAWELPSELVRHICAAQIALEATWGPAGIPTEGPCNTVVAEYLSGLVRAGARGGRPLDFYTDDPAADPYRAADPFRVSPVGDLRALHRRSPMASALLEAIAGERAHPGAAAGIETWTSALAKAQRDAAAASTALNDALEAGDVDRARELRDAVTIHGPKAVQDAHRGLAALEQMRQLTRLFHAEERVRVAEAEIAAADADHAAAREAMERAELRRKVALAFVDDARLIRVQVEADTAELREQLADLFGAPALDPVGQIRAQTRAQTAAAIGVQVETVQLPAVPTLRALSAGA